MRVKVARAAICGTDRHIYHWDESVRDEVRPPVVIGHEFCGHVDELGPGVNGDATGRPWTPGDYVSAEMHIVCRECRACRAGNFHVCERTRIAGLDQDGAFAEYVVLPAANLVRLDEACVPQHVGAFLDALGNAVHTVQSARGGVAGRHVLVSGFGAIGSMAAAVVEHEGPSSLTVTDVTDGALRRAREWAAQLGGGVPLHVLDPRELGAGLAAAVKERSEGGVDVVLEMSGAPPAINAAMEMLYPGGELLQLGIPAANDVLVEALNRRFIFKGLTWQGVIGRRIFGTWEKMLGLLAAGLRVEHVVTHQLPLSGFAEAIELLDAGEAQKVVLNPQEA